jgi:hypothetical protein
MSEFPAVFEADTARLRDQPLSPPGILARKGADATVAHRVIHGERLIRPDNPVTLRASEAASLLGPAPSTLAKLRLSGNGPVYCKLGRRVVYRRDDLAAWLDTRIARGTADAEARLPKSLTITHHHGVADDPQ